MKIQLKQNNIFIVMTDLLHDLYTLVLSFGKLPQILADNNLKSYDCILQHPYFLTSSL